MRHYKVATSGIDEAFERIDKMAQLAKMHTSAVDELAKLQGLLAIKGTTDSDANLPCIVLPDVRIHRFYDRDQVIENIDIHFSNRPVDDTEPRSIALYGLGVVGKSQAALKYATKKKADFEAILWMHSATPTALAQSCTTAAVALSLPGAQLQQHTENRVLLLNWLQKTRKSLRRFSKLDLIC